VGPPPLSCAQPMTVSTAMLVERNRSIFMSLLPMASR
jgi:hypothetical protein